MDQSIFGLSEVSLLCVNWLTFVIVKFCKVERSWAKVDFQIRYIFFIFSSSGQSTSRNIYPIASLTPYQNRYAHFIFSRLNVWFWKISMDSTSSFSTVFSYSKIYRFQLIINSLKRGCENHEDWQDVFSLFLSSGKRMFSSYLFLAFFFIYFLSKFWARYRFNTLIYNVPKWSDTL